MAAAEYGKAVKTTITITVYTSEPIVATDDFSEAEGFPFIEQVTYEMTYGHAVGSYEVGEPEPVEGEALRDALIAIGNDGTFFGDDE